MTYSAILRLAMTGDEARAEAFAVRSTHTGGEAVHRKIRCSISDSPGAMWVTRYG